jgi:hypothetical protein
METSGNPLITSAPRHGGDVLHPPDARRWWALALLCGARPQRLKARRTDPD